MSSSTVSSTPEFRRPAILTDVIRLDDALVLKLCLNQHFDAMPDTSELALAMRWLDSLDSEVPFDSWGDE